MSGTWLIEKLGVGNATSTQQDSHINTCVGGVLIPHLIIWKEVYDTNASGFSLTAV